MSADRPLAGRRIVVTRSADQADGFADALRLRGADPLLVPSIGSEPPPRMGALHDAVATLAGARWVGMTSPSGVRFGWAAVEEIWPAGLPAGLGVAVVGPGTADALAAHGVTPDFQPSEASGDAFAAELPLGPGDRVVLLRSDIARQAIAEDLRQRGAEVTDAVAYHTITEADPAAVARALDAAPHAITFTSPSTVRGFLTGVGDLRRLDGIPLVPIGPVTGEALTAAGLPIARIPDDYTIPGLVAALVILFSTPADAEASPTS